MRSFRPNGGYPIGAERHQNEAKRKILGGMSDHQLATDDDLDLSAPPRTRRLVAALVIGLHVVAVLGLIQAFAPGFTALVAEQVISTFTVTVTTPPPSPKPPEPPRAPDKMGAAAPVGKKAVPKAAAAPKPDRKSVV